MKTFTVRALVFGLLLLLGQFLVSSALPAELPQEVLRLQEYLSADVDVVYLGDSTLTYPVGEVATGEILQERLPEITIGAISHPAYNLDLYLHYVRYIRRGGYRPQAIILPVNMRSFSPEWDLRPGYQFDKVKRTLTMGLLVSRIFSRPLEIFGFYEPSIGQETFLNATVYNGDTPVGTVRDFEGVADEGVAAELQGDAGFVYHDALPSEDDEEALRQALIYRYMYRLHSDHRQLQAMLEIAQLGYASDIEIIFYITPINYQQGQRYLGETFVDTLEQNVDVVKSLLADRAGVTLLDLSTDLEAYAFVDMEHLRERGKVYVAEQLATAVEPDWATVAGPEEGDATPTPGRPTLTPVLPTATATPTARLTVTKPAATKVATKVPISPSVSGGTVTPSVSGGTVTPSPPITTTLGVVVEPTYLLRSTPEGTYPVDLYRLRYQTLDQEGQIVETRALLFVPYVETPQEFPVLVHAAGTTGIGNGCAPLDEQARERNWGNYYGHSLTYAAQGYIVILPNGLGFDDPDRIHPYFVAELQAHVLLDAARAAYRFAEHPVADDVLARPAEAVFFMGYSSGGHAAFAARDWAGSYASELPIKGVIGFGPTTDVETLMREDPVFSPYIVYAYRDFYGAEVVGVDDVFLPGWVPTFDSDVLTKCVDDIFVYYRRSAREMYSPDFMEVLYGDRLDQVYPLFAERLSSNDAGLLGGRRIPVLILQGTGDTVVTPESQRAFKDGLCARGGVVTYLEYPAVPHVQIRRTSFGDALAWMRQVAQGDVPDTDCRIITDRK